MYAIQKFSEVVVVKNIIIIYSFIIFYLFYD